MKALAEEFTSSAEVAIALKDWVRSRPVRSGVGDGKGVSSLDPVRRPVGEPMPKGLDDMILRVEFGADFDL